MLMQLNGSIALESQRLNANLMTLPLATLNANGSDARIKIARKIL